MLAASVCRRWLAQASQTAATAFELAAAYLQARQRQLLQWWWQASLALVALVLSLALAVAALLWSVPSDQRVAWAAGLSAFFLIVAVALIATCLRTLNPPGHSSNRP
jgi:uncharacterized membrane protein YqjE